MLLQNRRSNNLIALFVCIKCMFTMYSADFGEYINLRKMVVSYV
jgi:hypothetical protein